MIAALTIGRPDARPRQRRTAGPRPLPSSATSPATPRSCLTTGRCSRSPPTSPRRPGSTAIRCSTSRHDGGYRHRADRRPRAARRHRRPPPTPRRRRPADGRGASRTCHHRLCRPSRRRPLADRRASSSDCATTRPDAWTAGRPQPATTPSSSTPAGHGASGADPPQAGTASHRPKPHVVALVADGLSNAEIAQRLLMGRATVKTHLTHIFTKTGTENRSQLAGLYHRRPH